MRNLMLMSCLLLLPGATGCSRFAGEWIEEGSYGPDGVFKEASGQRRLALRFDPPATVRYGAFVNRGGVVDHQSVQTDTYQTMQGRRVAQFGSIIARVDRGRLIATIGGDVVTRFERVRGKRVFPSAVVLPSLATANGDPAGRLLEGDKAAVAGGHGRQLPIGEVAAASP